MNDSDHLSEEAAIASINAVLKQLTSRWTSLKKARIDLNFKTVTQALEGIDENVKQLALNWGDNKTVIETAIQDQRDFVLSDAYPLEVEQALRDAGVPIRGKFPSYEFSPFKLTFFVDSDSVKLGMGRKAQQNKALAPSAIALWVKKEYQRVAQSKFNAEQFGKELFTAYELLNRDNLTKNFVVWGHPIALKEIYKLLTLKDSAKQDYPEALFTYDLARLKEQVDVSYNGYRFEFVPSRNQSSGLLLVNSKGQESRVESLAIYEKSDR
jgi:hypothetical protein